MPASVRVRRESATPKFTPRSLAATQANGFKNKKARVSALVTTKGGTSDDPFSAFMDDMKELGALDTQ